MVLALTGCAATDTAEREVRAGMQAERDLSARGPDVSGPVARVEGPFLGRKVLGGGADPDRVALPARLETPTGFTLRAGSMSLEETAQAISRHTGIPVAVDRPGGTTGKRPIVWQPRHAGALSAFLDALAARFDVAWRFDGRTIAMRHEVSRVFPLAAGVEGANLRSTVSSAITDDGQESGQGGVSAQAKLDIWADLQTQIRTVLPTGTQFSLSQAAGTLTVTGRPSVLEQARRLVDRLNTILSPRVTAKVSLYLVDVSDGDDYGLNVALLFQDAGSGIRAFVNGLAPSVISAAGALGGGIAGPPEDSDTSSWDGSSVVARAVSASGRLIDQHHAVVSSRTAAATPVQLTRRINYVRELTATSGSLGVTTFGVEVETLVTGYSLQVVPRVTAGGRLSLFLAVSVSDLISLNTSAFGNDGAFLQLPEVARRAFNISTLLSEGEMLVLAGYDQSRAKREQTGTGKPGFLGLGGSTDAEVSKTRLIIAVQPHVRKSPVPLGPAAVRITDARS